MARGQVGDPDLIQDSLGLLDVLVEVKHELGDGERLKMGRGMLLTDYLLQIELYIRFELHVCR